MVRRTHLTAYKQPYYNQKMILFSLNPTKNLLPYDGIVNDFGNIIDEPNELYQTLLTTLPWQSDIVTLFGKTHITHRKIVWMGQADYRYSGHTRQGVAWTNEVFHVKQLVEQTLLSQGITAHFNACLLNFYPTGADGMGYHADDEKELGYEPIIASVSLGAERKFVFKHRVTKDKVAMTLQDGQLIVMRGQTQRHWLHSLPKTKKVSDGRINLTFRTLFG